MEEDNLNFHNINHFNGKEDILSAFLIRNNNISNPESDKSFKDDFFYKPEQNYLDEYFSIDNKSIKTNSMYKYDSHDIFLPNKIENNRFNNNKTIRKNSFENNSIQNYKNGFDDNKKIENVVFQNNPVKKQKINNQNSNQLIFVDKEREEKLLKNRLSARKCRQKKKKYIISLEEQVKIYKEEIEKYKKENEKKNYVENYFNLLEKNEKEIESCNIKKKIDCMKNEYIENQKLLLKKLFFKQVKIMMPIECKIFQNKFIKVLLFEENDSPEIILNKIIDNLKQLNELYDFKNKNKTNIKGKEEIAYKLYTFYEILQKYCELYITNLKSL